MEFFTFLGESESVSHSVMSNSMQPHELSPPDSPVHGILQARILEWIVISFSKGSSPPRDWALASHLAGRLFTDWAMIFNNNSWSCISNRRDRQMQLPLTCSISRALLMPWYTGTQGGGFIGGSVVKKPSANAGDAGSSPGSERSPGEGNSNPPQYSCLGNPMGSQIIGHNLVTK